MRSLVYLKAIVIVHGKSEKIISQHIKNKLRLKMEIISEKNGSNSIQLEGLMKILNNTKFKNYRSFIQNFQDVELIEDGKKLNDNFKIFIIVDMDDCKDESKKEKYKNKEMFKNHWAYEYIVPIYNSPNLEAVLKKAGVPFKTKGDNRKREYIKLFPIDSETNEIVKIEDLAKSLSKIKDTNLEKFLEFCLDASN